MKAYSYISDMGMKHNVNRVMALYRLGKLVRGGKGINGIVRPAKEIQICGLVLIRKWRRRLD